MYISTYMIKEVEKYKAIGEEIRLRILRVLVKAQQELCVCEIVDVLEKPQYNISKNLSILRKAELVEEQRAGKLMMYKVINEFHHDNDYINPLNSLHYSIHWE